MRSHDSLLLTPAKPANKPASTAVAAPVSPALSPCTPTAAYLNLTISRHTIISFAAAAAPAALSSDQVYSELAGRPLFRFVHDPDLVDLLRCLSSAGQCVLTPYTCFIRWRSPWEQRFRRTELTVLLLADGYTFDLVLRRPRDVDVLDRPRKITRVANICMRDTTNGGVIVSTPLRNTLFNDNDNDDDDSSDGTSGYSDTDEPAEMQAPVAVLSLGGTLRQLMQHTLPDSVQGYCSAAMDSVEELAKEQPIDIVRSGVGAVVGLGVGLGKEASMLMWRQLSKQG